MTVTTKPGHRGEYDISRKAIAQGRPGCSRFTCMLVCVFLAAHLHTRPRVQRAPGLPRALFFEGRVRPLFEGRRKLFVKLGRSVSRECERISARHRAGMRTIQ